MSDRALTVGDQIAEARARDMPCFCDLLVGAELIDRRVRTRCAEERLQCPCGLVFRRVWVRGQ